jgi:hypothetical protein
MTIIEELGLAETIFNDATAFANDQPLAASKVVGKIAYSGSVVKLPNGPTNTQYQVFSGSFLGILAMAFEDYAGFAAGTPIMIAEKLNNDWYGTTLSGTPVAA